MTKLDLVFARIRKLPAEEQQALAAEIELRLDNLVSGSAFTDEEWAEIEATMDESGETRSHADVVAEMRAKYPG
ncbi:MAG TPA: hypothetical protein VEA80_16515 [Vitreimonas sp.]|uniref:hypothetical protein n=1 Tax=Vitreimonas sp. TaxID=3069702 RepID=UPI002D5994BB|nr:hypothetical protein [Vitreimonas sp.]HYD89082.1 hypothetical protein [Vitreimonas sp.]